MIMESHRKQKTLIKPVSFLCVAKQLDGATLIISCKLSFFLIFIVLSPTLREGGVVNHDVRQRDKELDHHAAGAVGAIANVLISALLL